jgi:uncharacterized protein YecE (DUF72 family)
MAKLLIGTSGWTYASWKGTFYPSDLPSRRYLEFYAREFPTTEVNYSFYRLPKPSTYENWSGQVPEDFVFAVKVSRFITHIKRLQDVDEAWRTFIHNARHLGGHLGPILLQFPPSAPCDLTKLKRFLTASQPVEKTAARLRLVFEFRHDSWFTDRVYRLLNQYQAALCIADSARYARQDIITSDFAYMRYHGPQQLFSSKYPDEQLAKEARTIRKHMRSGLDVYVFFNNDALGHAIENARTLRAMVKERVSCAQRTGK